MFIPETTITIQEHDDDLLSVTLELRSPTIFYDNLRLHVPLRHFLMVCYCFSTILNYSSKLADVTWRSTVATPI